jgi:pyridoxamine 5'-phosphate oxidase
VSELREQDVDPDPLRQFLRWFEEARAAGLELPEAVVLATATRSGAPSARMVLLKGADDRGFVFYSGYGSRKGRELAENPSAALLFYWPPLGRQVRVEGVVVRTSREESDDYFRSRPARSRLSAAASPQSEVVASRDALEFEVKELARLHPAGEVPRPDDWGGFRLTPREYEFWQHREDRLHDRLRYRRDRDAWVVERLGP